MTISTSIFIPWRQRAAVTRNEAAIIFNETPDWIQDRIEAGDLFPLQMKRGGPRLVCVQSILDLLERTTGYASFAQSVGPAVQQPRPKYPALVWSNPNR